MNFKEIFMEYENYFSWVSRAGDVIEKIEGLHDGLKVDYSNYRDIFMNLDKYVKIDDVILNTETHPFLENAIKGALDYQDKNFKIIFSDLLSKKDLREYNLCDSENQCNIKQIRKEISDGILKFFEKSGENLDFALSESFSNYNHNLKFVNYKDIFEKASKKFSEFNSRRENLSELESAFKKKIEKYINFEHITHSMAFKLDLAKILSIFDSEKNVLVHDFDQGQYFDLEISDEYSNFPKFSLFKIDFHEGKPFVPFICAFGLNYLPKSLEKMYLVFFDHTMENLNNKFKNVHGFVYIGNLIYTEIGLEILFEYISSKNFQTNDEIKNFFDLIDYHDLYKEYDEFYRNHIKKKSIDEYRFDFNYFHFENTTIEKMHLIEKNGEPINHFWFKHDSENDKSGGTWLKTLKKNSSMSEKNNIFDQIKTINLT